MQRLEQAQHAIFTLQSRKSRVAREGKPRIVCILPALVHAPRRLALPVGEIVLVALEAAEADCAPRPRTNQRRNFDIFADLHCDSFLLSQPVPAAHLPSLGLPRSWVCVQPGQGQSYGRPPPRPMGTLSQAGTHISLTPPNVPFQPQAHRTS